MPIALTFDDGPDPAWTPQVLDALALAGASATFFVVAPRAEHDPELIARIAEEGHEVALHCDAHERHTEHDLEWGRADTARALARLDGVGVQPRLWRTPWGAVAPWTEGLAAEHDLCLVGWTADTHDWRGDSAGEMLEAIRPGLVDGAVVLCHDGLGPGARRAGCAETVALIGRVAELAAAQGVALTALGPDNRPAAAAGVAA